MAKAATATARETEVPASVEKYNMKAVFTEAMLATSPMDPKVYEQYIASRERKDADERGDEVATLPAGEIEKIGSSVFHRDETGLFIFDYKLRGFLKAAAEAVTGTQGMSAYRSKINKWCFVSPRRIYLEEETGGVVQEPHDSIQRPIRAMTQQGPRTSVKRSECVKPGTFFVAQILILPLGQHEMNKKRLEDWLSYGIFSGIGEWRTGSYGRFTYEIEKVK
jgi:hypothetical protein